MLFRLLQREHPEEVLLPKKCQCGFWEDWENLNIKMKRLSPARICDLHNQTQSLKTCVDKINVTNYDEIRHTLQDELSCQSPPWKLIGQIGRDPARCCGADWSPVAPGALSPL